MKRKRKSSVGQPTPIVEGTDEKWRAQSDLRTLRDAHEIMADGKRHRAAHAEAKKQMVALQKITGRARGKPRSGSNSKAARDRRLENAEI